MVVDINRPAFQDGLGKDKKRHVRPAPRTVNREESQARAGKLVKMSIDMRHELITLLRRCIQAERVVNIIVNREWQVLVGSVH